MSGRWAAAGLVVLVGLGCGGGQPRSLPGTALRPGTRVADLPPGYGLVIGKVEVVVGRRPLRCALAPAHAPCGLGVRYQTGETFLIPQQPPESLAPGGASTPFFVIRLPEGAYEVTRFDVPPEAVEPGVRSPRSGGIPLRKTFTVGEGEFLYVGSLFVDAGDGAKGRVDARVLDERDEAARVAAEIDPEAAPELLVRLLE